MYMIASATIRPNSNTKPSSPRLPCEIISPTCSSSQLPPRISWNSRLAFFLQMVSSLIRVAPFLDRLTVDYPTVEPLIQISTNSSITSKRLEEFILFDCFSTVVRAIQEEALYRVIIALNKRQETLSAIPSDKLHER